MVVVQYINTFQRSKHNIYENILSVTASPLWQELLHESLKLTVHDLRCDFQKLFVLGLLFVTIVYMSIDHLLSCAHVQRKKAIVILLLSAQKKIVTSGVTLRSGCQS